MKKILLAAALLLPLRAFAAEPLDKLAGKLAEAVKDRKGLKVAVMELPYAGGKVSEGPVVIQERLTTLLAGKGGLTLIERAQLKKVMGELNLQSSGAIDAETAQKLGKVLGAEAIVTGTLNDVKEDRTEVNARVVETSSGKILAASSAQVKKTWKDGGAVQPDRPKGDDAGKALVQVAVLLDTSNSMDGLINQARTQVWKIVNELISAEKSGSKPVIEVALYEYGNSGLPQGSGWIRQVLPLTRDLDKVASELFALKTNGGDEYAGQVVERAVKDLKWSPKTDVYKVIFIAGNEPFTQGPVDYRSASALAKSKGIFVNTVFCGPRQQGQATGWQEGAFLADGEFTNIEQDYVAAAIQAPQDDEIVKLSQKLGQTSLAYGAAGARGMANRARLESTMAAAPSAGAMLAERAVAKSKSVAADAEWDAVSAVESGELKKDQLKREDLPPEMRKMSKEELEKHIDAQIAERKKIRAEITRLESERKRYIAAEEKKRASSPNTLDKAVIETVRKQAAKRGYQFK